MDFSLCGQWCPPVLLFSRVVCTSTLSSEKSHISGLYPATFLDLPLRVLEVWTLFPSLTLKIGYSASFGVSIFFQVLLKWSVLFGPLQALQMAHSIPRSAELLEVYWSFVSLSNAFFPTLGEGGLYSRHDKFLLGHIGLSLRNFICFVSWLHLIRDLNTKPCFLGHWISQDTWRNHLNIFGFFHAHGSCIEIFSCTRLESTLSMHFGKKSKCECFGVSSRDKIFFKEILLKILTCNFLGKFQFFIFTLFLLYSVSLDSVKQNYTFYLEFLSFHP